MQLPWRRQQSTSANVPKEVHDYYQAEKRERVGVATMLAIGTLLVTIILAIGIFFGGRWVWRHTVEHGKKANPITATVHSPDDTTSSTTTTTNKSATAAPTGNTNTTTPAGSSASNSTNNSVSTGKTTTPATPPTAPTTKVATNGHNGLPTTGPSNLFLPIAGIVVVGFVSAEAYQRRVYRG